MDQSRYLITGDVVYGENRFGISRHVIERTTKTLAIADNGKRFKVKVHFNGSVDVFGDDDEFWKSKSYKIEEPKIKEEYERQEICGFLKSFDFRSLRIEPLQVISAIVRGEINAVNIIDKLKNRS